MLLKGYENPFNQNCSQVKLEATTIFLFLCLTFDKQEIFFYFLRLYLEGVPSYTFLYGLIVNSKRDLLNNMVMNTDVDRIRYILLIHNIYEHAFLFFDFSLNIYSSSWSQPYLQGCSQKSCIGSVELNIFSSNCVFILRNSLNMYKY